MNWAMLAATFSGLTLASVVAATWHFGVRFGRVEQRIEDIDEKGCTHRRNGIC